MNPRRLASAVFALTILLTLAGVLGARSTQAGVSTDPVTQRYITTLRTNYLTLVRAFGKAVGPCTTVPTPSSLATCRQRDGAAVTDAQRLLDSLQPMPVPKAATAADKAFRSSVKALIAALKSRIKYIDANDLPAFKRADGAVSYALGLNSAAIGALNRAIKTARLPVLFSTGP